MIHCFHVCQELYAADDPLSVKYSIEPFRNTSQRLVNEKMTLKAEKADEVVSTTLEQTVDSGETNNSVLSHSKPPDSDISCDFRSEEPPGPSKLPSVPEEAEVNEPTRSTRTDDSLHPLEEIGTIATRDAPEELIIWQSSTAAKTFGCRGWYRSDDEWERRPEISARRRDSNLTRCVDDPKFRTRLCNHWDESLGTLCPMRKKGKCIFAHGPVELRVKEAKRNRWGKLVDKNGDNKNPNHSGGEDTYGAARAIESERKQEGKWKTKKPAGPKGKKAPTTKKKSSSRPPAALSLTTICLLGLSMLTNSVGALSAPHIQVCQNKDCCQRWRHRTPLPEVLTDLLQDTVTIETTSCLSQCEKGPNICVTANGEEEQLHKIENPTIAVALLEESLEQKIPSKLLAAVNVLEKAIAGTFVNLRRRRTRHWKSAASYRVAINCFYCRLFGAICSQKERQGRTLVCFRLSTERKENLDLLHLVHCECSAWLSLVLLSSSFLMHECCSVTTFSSPLYQLM